MMMKIGKTLVYSILVFSVAMVAMSWTILGNQFNWAGAPPSPSEPGSLHDQNAKKIEEAQKDLVRLRGRWKGDADNLAVLEARRKGHQAFYKEELGFLREKEVKAIKYEADGKLITDASGRPVLEKNGDARLKPFKVLDDDLKKLDVDLKETITAVNELIEEQKKLTLILRGDPGKVKGLLALLAESDRDRRNAEVELEQARQEAINGRVSVQSLLKRQKQLEARIKELREFNLAQKQP
jgi:hypothetical protein